MNDPVLIWMLRISGAAVFFALVVTALEFHRKWRIKRLLTSNKRLSRSDVALLQEESRRRIAWGLAESHKLNERLRSLRR